MFHRIDNGTRMRKDDLSVMPSWMSVQRVSFSCFHLSINPKYNLQNITAFLQGQVSLTLQKGPNCLDTFMREWISMT